MEYNGRKYDVTCCYHNDMINIFFEEKTDKYKLFSPVAVIRLIVKENIFTKNKKCKIVSFRCNGEVLPLVKVYLKRTFNIDLKTY